MYKINEMVLDFMLLKLETLMSPLLGEQVLRSGQWNGIDGLKLTFQHQRDQVFPWLCLNGIDELKAVMSLLYGE